MPAEWANQDLGGRNQATDLVGLLTGTGGMVDGLNGWFVFTIGPAAGNADTYVYRTHDGAAPGQRPAGPPWCRRRKRYTGFPPAPIL